ICRDNHHAWFQRPMAYAADPMAYPAEVDEGTTSRPGARSALAFGVASAAANVLAYVFTIAMSRLLGVRDFGEMGTQLAVWLIAQIPTRACQLTAAKAVAAGLAQRAATAAMPALPGGAAGERGVAAVGGAGADGAAAVGGAVGESGVVSAGRAAGGAAAVDGA